MLTIARAERELYQAARSPALRLRNAELRPPTVAKVVMSEKSITIDPHFACPVESVVHELFHLVYRKRLSWWGEFEEGFVTSGEADVIRYIYRSKRRIKQWRRIAQELRSPIHDPS